MADYYALTSDPLPDALHGADGEFSVRTLSDAERLAIEDYFFKREIKVALSSKTTAVVVPQSQAASATLEDMAVLVEFALGVLTVSGFQSVGIVATLSDGTCSAALQNPQSTSPKSPVFAKRVTKAAASAWMRSLFAARLKVKSKLRITADRFTRYLKTSDSHDALVDLCICLESLIDAQAELSFRFSACLAKISGQENPEEISNLLSALYDLRSKVVHGADFTKQHNRVKPSVSRLHFVARAVLTSYVLFLAEHSNDEWKKHLSGSLFT